MVLVSCSFIVYGQDESLYSQFDKIIGPNNTKLSYGVIYKEKYRKKHRDNHNFYQDDSFKRGSIIYRGQVFNNIELKYELVDDFLVIQLSNNNQITSIIPEKSLVQKFSIENKKFINSSSFGFLEELLIKEEFSVLKKHRKLSKENRDADYRYHTFKKQEGYILFYNDNYFSIDSKRDFVKLFPNSKKQISKFYKDNKFLIKNDYKTFVAKLITSLPQV